MESGITRGLIKFLELFPILVVELFEGGGSLNMLECVLLTPVIVDIPIRTMIVF